MINGSSTIGIMPGPFKVNSYGRLLIVIDIIEFPRVDLYINSSSSETLFLLN